MRTDTNRTVNGRKWNLIIIWHILTCKLGFFELQSRMCGINSKMITKHLRDLEQNNIVTRTVYAEVPPRVECTLTNQGRGVLPIIDAMLIWGDTWLGHGEETECSA